MSKTYDFCGFLMKKRGEEAVKRRKQIDKKSKTS
jgi:hypothetical protein